MLHKISKPHLVDLLRMSDHNRWLQPRIRYASVRSKPELIRDLEDHFLVKEHCQRLHFEPRRARNLPRIEYSLKNRSYLIDDKPMDLPRASRKKPIFCVKRGAVTLYFQFPRTNSESPSKRLGVVFA